MKTMNFARKTTVFCAAAALAASLGVQGAAPPGVKIVPAGGLVYHVVIKNTFPFLGGEIGLLYDENLMSIVLQGVTPGPDWPDFPAGDGEIRVDLNPRNGCPVNKELRGGLAIGWCFSIDAETALPAGEHAVLELRFEEAPGGGGVPRFEFVRCLGEAEAPIRTMITDVNGESVLLWPETGIEPEGIPFVRGDVNDDGRHDLSDAIYVLDYLFAGRLARPGCIDAVDVNDSGSTEITDAVYLLRYLFAQGAPLPYPFPTCGLDLTGESAGDSLDCERYDHCN